MKAYKELGFDAVQFHDDDIVPADLDWPSAKKGVADVNATLGAIEGVLAIAGVVRGKRAIDGPRIFPEPRAMISTKSPSPSRIFLTSATPFLVLGQSSSAGTMSSS